MRVSTARPGGLAGPRAFRPPAPAGDPRDGRDRGRGCRAPALRDRPAPRIRPRRCSARCRRLSRRFRPRRCGDRSAVLADPLRLPKYTVMPMPRSRWYSTVSTSPSRTVVVSPFCRLTSASAWRGAQLALARFSDFGNDALELGNSGSVDFLTGLNDCLHGRIVRCRQKTISENSAAPARARASARPRPPRILGTRLIALKESELAALDLPETLFDAILLAKRITSRGGLARQRQYIGKLMRDIDPAPIEAALVAESRGHGAGRRETQAHRSLAAAPAHRRPEGAR